jgi:steroid delta-isomerase-like uncharacterized protein
MSTKGNKELVRQVIKERNEFAGDAAKVCSWCEKYCAPGYIYHNLIGGDMNREQLVQYFVSLMSTMPDHNKSIDDMVAEGDKVVIRYTVQGTQKGAILGIPATGKHVSITACDIYKIEGGKKILEWWEFPDYLGGIIKAGVIFSAPPKT